MINLYEDQTCLKNLYDASEIEIAATNTWISSDFISDSLKIDKERGNADKVFYNMFVRVTGVEDKADYARELFYWKNNLEKKGKTVYIIDKVAPITVEEVEKINPQNYTSLIQMVDDLARKIRCPYAKLRNQAVKTFVDYMIEESHNTNGNFGKLRNMAISLVSLFIRYGQHLYKKDRMENLPVLIYFGTCTNVTEERILKFFAYLPVDVIILNPNLDKKCSLTDSRLFDIKYKEKVDLEKFPEKIDEVSFTTVAYNAEKDLETIMYEDTGMFKLRQHTNATSVTLKTMYEEIYMLWDQEIRMRTGFQILKDKVVIPTIAAKISGVKNQNVDQYWRDINSLDSDDAFMVTKTRFYDKTTENFNTLGAISYGKVNRDNIINNSDYKYGIYREEMQVYLIDKLEELINSKLIVGTLTKGAEHAIIKVAMNLDKRVLRLIQSLDFTKKNPKIVLINTTEEEYGFEESILIAYLHLIGFDIVMYMPTGYRLIEKYYTQPFFIEHNVGEFMYDLHIPNIIKSEDIGEKSEKEAPETFFQRLLRR